MALPAFAKKKKKKTMMMKEEVEPGPLGEASLSLSESGGGGDGGGDDNGDVMGSDGPCCAYSLNCSRNDPCSSRGWRAGAGFFC